MPVLSDLPCVGRRGELRLLVGGLASAEKGVGSCWLLTGPAGIGKSRILRQLAHLAGQRGFVVRNGCGLEGSISPLLPFRQIMPDMFPAQGHGWPIAGAPRPRSARHGRPEPVDLEILEVIQRLERESLERPQVVLLDDLEFADPESWRCLGLLSRTAREHRIVVLAAARIGSESWEDSRLGRRLLELRRGELFRWQELSPLTEDALTELAAELLGQRKESVRSSGELSELVRLAGGSPFFLIELVLAWSDAQRNVSGTGVPPAAPTAVTGAAPTPSVPPTVRSVIGDRLLRLPTADLEMLRLGAYLGLEFAVEPLADALGRSVREVDARLERLAHLAWPISATGVRDVYAFEHQLVRAVLLTSKELETEAPAMHRLVTWWSRHRTDDPVTEARLREAIGDREGSLACVERSVDLLLERSAFRSLVEVLVGEDAPLRAGEDPDFDEIVLAVAARLREMLESDWAGTILDRLPTHQLAPPSRWLASCWLAETAVFRDPPRMRRMVDELETAARVGWARGVPDTAALLTYLRALRALADSRNASEAHPAIARAARLLARWGQPLECCRLLHLESAILADRGRWDAARASAQEARRVAARAGDRCRDLRLLVISGERNVEFTAGLLRPAWRGQLALAREYRRRGQLGLEARAMLTLGYFETRTGPTTVARRHLGHAEEILTTLGNPRQLAACRAFRGWTHLLDGQWDAAEQAFRATVELPIVDDPSGSRQIARIGLALVEAERGQPRRALRMLRAVQSETTPPSSYFQTEYYTALARILELSGDTIGARETLTQAVGRVRAPLADRAELFAQMSRWHRLYGTPRDAARWDRRFAALPPDLRRSGVTRWRGLGFVGRAGPSPDRRLPATAARPTMTGGSSPFRSRILLALQRDHERWPVSGGARPAEGLSEVQLAQLTQLPRERFARALRRLCQEGAIEREIRRPASGGRRVYAYRLATSRG